MGIAYFGLPLGKPPLIWVRDAVIRGPSFDMHITALESKASVSQVKYQERGRVVALDNGLYAEKGGLEKHGENLRMMTWMWSPSA